MACSSQVLIVSPSFQACPSQGYPKPVFPQGEGETETFGLKGGIGRKGKLGARGVASEQGRGLRERKAGRDTHWDTGRNKEREEKCQGRMGEKRWEAREEHMQEQGEEGGCEREYALGGRREGRFHGGE